jgi:hypothetical protein
VAHEDDRARRARARAHWPIARTALGNERSEDLSATTTADERLAMMWPLALDAWAAMGEPIPDYPRNEAPGRVIRRRER